MWTMLLLGVAWLAAPTAVDATGRIVAEDGTPLYGAQVCEITPGAEERCVLADEQGLYTITRTTHPTLLVRLRGYVATTIDAAPLAQPVKLHRAATLFVSVVDASTGESIHEGRVMVDTPSGKRIGNFVPFNKSGVRISTLDPGIVFVRADAGGYDSGGPVPVELAAGAERSVIIKLKLKATGGSPR